MEEIGLFYNEHKEAVRQCVGRALSGNGNKSIDDVTQEVFVVILKTWPAAKESPNPAGFAINTANNLVLEYHRREKKLMHNFRQASDDEEEPADTSAGIPFDDVEESFDAVRAGVTVLDSSSDRLEYLLKPLAARRKQQEAVELHHARGLSVKESVEFTGSYERTFRNNASLGLAALKEHFRSEPPEP